jgi:Endonuclease/Exonuclease/phosphatase family.
MKLMFSERKSRFTITRNIIVANIHAPCAHNMIKINFFNEVLNTINDLQQLDNECEVIILGDYNTAFAQEDRQNTKHSREEVNIANKIKQIFLQLNLTDCWERSRSDIMTWRHGEKMSRLDRIKWSMTSGRSATAH